MPSPFKYELTRLSATHEAIADWLIANPGKGQMERCAAHFGYTRAWLSTLIHQDAFQAMLQAKQGVAFEQVVIPLREKIAGVAHRGVEKLGEILEETQDSRLVADITRDSLKQLGYGASTAGPVIDNSVHNTMVVNSDALAAARERRSQHYRRDSLESPSQPQSPESEAQTLGLSHDQGATMGEARDRRADVVNVEAPVYRDEETGGEV
jgi:hypothetical protein